jgi:MFS family permease
MTRLRPPGRPSSVGSRPPLALFFAGNVCVAAGLIAHAFLFNFYLRELGLSASAMGQQVAAMTLGGLVALLPAGMVIDRFGVRAALLGGVTIATVGLALTALLRSPSAIYAAAAVVGIGGASCRVAWGPALMRLASDEQRTRAFSWNVALLIATGGAWTLLAGLLPAWSARAAAATGLSGTQVALLVGAGISALAVACYWPLQLPRETPLGRPAPSVWPPREVRVLVPLVALWMLAAALVLPFFNIFFVDRFGMPVARVGALFALAQLVTAAALVGAAEVARRWGPQRALIAWMLTFAPALWWLAVTDTLGVAMTLYLLQGSVGPATNPLIDQVLLEGSPRDRHGVVAGWRNAAAESAGALGAGVGGRLLDATSFATLLFVAGAVAAVSAPLLAIGLLARPPRRNSYVAWRCHDRADALAGEAETEGITSAPHESSSRPAEA